MGIVDATCKRCGKSIEWAPGLPRTCPDCAPLTVLEGHDGQGYAPQPSFATLEEALAADGVDVAKLPKLPQPGDALSEVDRILG